LVGYQEILGLPWANPYWYHPVWHIRPVSIEVPSLPENLVNYPLYRVLPPFLTPSRHGKIRVVRRKKRPEDVGTEMHGSSSAAGQHLTNTAPTSSRTGVFTADNGTSGPFPPPAVPGPSHAIAGTSELAHAPRKMCNKCGARHDESACVFLDHNYIVHRKDNINAFMEVLRAPVLPPEILNRLLHGKRTEAVVDITFDMVPIVDEGDASDTERNENDVDNDDDGNEDIHAAGGGPPPPPLLAPGEDRTQPQQVEHDSISDDAEIQQIVGRTADAQTAPEIISSTRSHLIRVRRPPNSLLE
jgi:hypothetical protein